MRPRAKHIPQTNWINLLAICLTGGFFLSVLVAWWCAFIEDAGSKVRVFAITHSSPTTHPDVQQPYAALRKSNGWLHWDLHDGAIVKIMSQAYDVTVDSIIVERIPTREGPSWSLVQHPPTAKQIRSGKEILEEARGWPMACAFSVIETDSNRASWRIIAGIEFGSHTSFPACPRVFPVKPILLGLFVDTLFYVPVAWVLVRILRSVRSVIRNKRGLCCGCGYIINSLDQCPECGLEK